MKPKRTITTKLEDQTGTTKDRVTKQVLQTLSNGGFIDTDHDPVARQYFTTDAEKNILPEEKSDPIGDFNYTPMNGLVHRYPDRILVKLTDTCHVYCRFCFRKEMVGKNAGCLSSTEIDNIVAYVRSAPQVKEVIFSGGDPLTLSNRRLSDIIQKFESIKQLDVLRIHTRTPLVKPERIDSGFLDIIRNCKKSCYLILHVNHAREINDNVVNTLSELRRSGAVLLSQSVLLKGVNDTTKALEELFRTLVRHGVTPYYLHHPDLAPGTSHFRVSIAQGRALMKNLQGRLSGICLPTYILDIPGGHGKSPIGHNYIQQHNEGWRIENYQGEYFDYQDICNPDNTVTNPAKTKST